MTERLQRDITLPTQFLGEVALQTPEAQERDLFEVTAAELTALIPSTADGQKTFKELLIAARPKASRGDQEQNGTGGNEEQEPEPDLGPHTPGRSDIRRGKSIYGKHIVRIIRTGALFVASFDDPEEGIRAGREIFTDDYDEVLGDAYTTRLVPASRPLRQLRIVSKQAAVEVQALAGDDETSIAQRYMLLKALAGGVKKDKDPEKEDYEKLSARAALSSLLVMENVDVQRQMAIDLQAGTFDRHIAHDILWFLDGAGEVDSGLLKVRQLVTFLSAFTGAEQSSKPDFYNRMIHTLNAWPPSQRQVILDARQALLDSLQTNLSRTTSAMKENDFIGIEDPEEAFADSLDAFDDEIARRTGMQGALKAQVMAYRARTSKRGRLPKQRKRKETTDLEGQGATPEARREPLKLVTCNLNDYSITEGVAEVIDEFVKATSQGNITLRADVERILNFMARTDLPPEHRRGVKSINGARVRFGIDEDPDKLWDFFELKPSEAAGLSTKTAIAKSLRVYFIKMGDNTLGIIGIKARSEQDEFLRRIRVKTKQRG